MSGLVVTWVGWTVLAVAVLFTESIAHLRTRRVPSLASVLGFVARRPAGRCALLLVWVWVGVHVFAR